MKKVNWDNSRIRNLVDHETPFVVLDVPDGVQIRLYWTKGGMYGPQVLALIYHHVDGVLYEFTDGCGYNKEHAALEYCFSELGRMPRGFKEHQNLYPYEVGGNYHRVPKKDWLVWQ